LQTGGFVESAAQILVGHFATLGWEAFMLYAMVSRGKNRGARLLPHRFKDQRYRVQLGKQGPYIPLADSRDIPRYLANGYSLQMSAAESVTPSLIRPESIRGWERTVWP